MKVREVRTVCDKGDGLDAERVYIALPDGRYPVDLCEKHIGELRKWIPEGAKKTSRQRKVTPLDEVENKRKGKKAAAPKVQFQN